VSTDRSRKVRSVVDCGAKGGIAGSDVCVIEKSERSVDVRGIDNHEIVNIPIVTAGGVVTTQCGPTIAILHQYAYTARQDNSFICPTGVVQKMMSMTDLSRLLEDSNISSPMMDTLVSPSTF